MRLAFMMAAAALTVAVPALSQASAQRPVLAGGYGSGGVVAVEPGIATPQPIAQLHSPTFMLRHPKLPILYVSSELGGGNNLRAYRLGGSPVKATMLSALPSGGANPVRIAIDTKASRMVVANYDGSFAVFALSSTGAIGKQLASARIATADTHPHDAEIVGSQLLVADLGQDAVFVYDLAKSGAVSLSQRIDLPKDTGPRQVLAVSATRVLVPGELDGSLTTLARGPAGWKVAQSLVVRPAGLLGEILLHPSGKWLVVLARATGECVVYRTDGTASAEHARAACGGWPRHAAFSADGATLWVVAQRADEVRSMRFDATTGSLTPSTAHPLEGAAVVVP